MQIISDIFYIIVFMSMTGSVFTILSLWVNRVMHCVLPFWFTVCGMVVYLIPLTAPELWLIAPDEHQWIDGFGTASTVWLCGVIFCMAYDVIRTLLAKRAIQGCRVCDDTRINHIVRDGAGFTGLNKIPKVYFGNLDDSACVAGILQPMIILNKTVIEQLTDAELTMVICHETMHIRHHHIILGRVCDFICIINWFNPFVWIMKQDFCMHCETDCDSAVLVMLNNHITCADYANTLVRLLELSTATDGRKRYGMSALGFLMTKSRIQLIMGRTTRLKKVVTTAVLLMHITIVFSFSLIMSRGYFYPYPANCNSAEYSVPKESGSTEMPEK